MASFDLVLLLRSLCGQLIKALSSDILVSSVGTKLLPELCSLLVKLLEEAQGKKLFVLLDSLDQLLPSHNAHALDWLPLVLPEGVHLIASVLDADNDRSGVNLLQVLKAKTNVKQGIHFSLFSPPTTKPSLEY